MKKQLVFIDDSGDPGFKGAASSSAFVMAGAVIMSPEVASEINQRITKLRKELGWKEWHEFKFNKATKKVRLKFLKILSNYDFKIYAVFVRKIRYPQYYRFHDDKNLYNWTIKELLSIMDLRAATVNIDGKYGRPYHMHIRAFIRQNLNASEKRIAKFDVHDSARDNLIQLADFIAGSVNRSLQTDKTDSQDYIKIIKNKIIELRELDLDNPFGRD